MATCEGTSMQVADRSVRFAVETLRMDGVEGGGSGGGSSTGDPLATVSGEGGGGGASGGAMPAVSTVYVTIPQTATVVSAGNKGIQSVIQQPSQPSVIQSTALQTTALQTVQLSKGNVILLKQPSNSVIQSPGGGNLQTVQVLEAGEEQESSRKRQILARRPSYRKILNELGGGEISDKGEAGSSDSSQDEPPGTVTIGGQQYQTAVIPASSLQLSGQGTEGLQTIAMTNAATAGGAVVHYAPGSDPQFIVPVATGDLSSLKIATSTSAGLAQGVVLATTGSTVHGSGDQIAEEASRKREIRLMKNREAARECRAKKKEYIKCLENRVAVLENQNKALIEELKTLKALYCQNS
ncbi:cyclic AMP-responsive element-binding protein 1-like isoform X3 [Penaeus japonicus]|uniref:cyclic AMP-responsive element-binding protein 1-like isoform X3 n=1 Tax=Penaeus japonicus TaxID=27405 RepID=UPI001C712103|nr:cyclic AMP-responsive element-binding protein 1-like isoform X3 [Penaeus japonicus]